MTSPIQRSDIVGSETPTLFVPREVLNSFLFLVIVFLFYKLGLE